MFFFCLFPPSTLSFKREKGFLIYPIVLCLFGNGLCLFFLLFFPSFLPPPLTFPFPLSYLRDAKACVGFSFEFFPFGILVIPKFRAVG